MTVAATPIAFARAMVAAYERRGMNPSGALRQAQITPFDLRQPHGHITARQMEALSAAAMQELDDEALGAFSRPLPWGSYGMLARAYMKKDSQAYDANLADWHEKQFTKHFGEKRDANVRRQHRRPRSNVTRINW